MPWLSSPSSVMPGLDPGTQRLRLPSGPKTWMAGIKPGHDGRRHLPRADFPWHDRHESSQGIRMRKFCLAIFLGAVICSTPAFAARCGGDFNTFVAAMSQEAAAAGISQAVISQALGGVTQDPAVLAFDRRQRGTFNKSFEQYVSTRVGPGRINWRPADAAAACRAAVAHRAEVRRAAGRSWSRSGGWRRDFGKGDIGKMPVIRTLATMAHDCRRTELFQGELLAALKIVQRGDLPLARPDRRLCRRDRPDAIPAVVLHQIRRRFRRRRPRRSAPQRARRARLHRQPAAHQRLQDGRALRRRHRRISRRCASGTGRRSIARRSGISRISWLGR